VLCPMNRGGLGARALNLALQQALNSPATIGWSSSAGSSARATKVM